MISIRFKYPFLCGHYFRVFGCIYTSENISEEQKDKREKAQVGLSIISKCRRSGTNTNMFDIFTILLLLISYTF